MPDYYGPTEEQDAQSQGSFAERFDPWVMGQETWRRWIHENRWRERTDDALDDLRTDMRDHPRTIPPSCPRVFISHRQGRDAVTARSIARHANHAGFAFWLDVLDPNLAWLAAQGFDERSDPYRTLVASIIEVALLNCTHVVAVLSDQTRGSLWLPYEYGRVKERTVHSRRAAMWLDRTVPASDVPEYGVLGRRFDTGPQLTRWFIDELAEWQKTGQCLAGGASAWDKTKGGSPAPLP